MGIETSCDETAAAVVADGKHILSNQIASQVAIHARYGGIVPEVASRQHVLTIIPVIEQALKEAGVDYTAHIYPGVNHGFHNDTTPRYDEEAARLAWDRTRAFFDEHLR